MCRFNLKSQKKSILNAKQIAITLTLPYFSNELQLCLLSGRGTVFTSATGRGGYKSQEFHCLEESPRHVYLGVNCSTSVLVKSTQLILAALAYSWPGRFTLPGNPSLCQLVLLNNYFLKAPASAVLKRSLPLFNFLIHVKPNRRKTGQKVHTVKL